MRVTRTLYAVLCALGFCSAGAAQPAHSSTGLDETALAKTFLPTKLLRHDLGDNAGALYCPAGACDDLAKPSKDEPEFLTYHTVRLGRGAPALHMECSGAAQLACMAYLNASGESQWQAGREVYSGAFDLLFAPGDGCLYSVEAAHADHVTRRKYCWTNGQFKEQQQAMSYVGFTSVANRELALYSSQQSRKPFHHIPKNGTVEILAATPGEEGPSTSKWLLVRDAFGITGWVPVAALGTDNACLSGSPLAIRGFCSAGD